MTQPHHGMNQETEAQAEVQESVQVEVDDGVGIITIDRPERRNALNTSVLARLSRALEDLRHDEAVRVIIVTGAGEAAFVAGADIGELARREPADGLRASMQRAYDAVEAVEKPTIAAVNGYAFGGGLELALACDIRIASDNALFALPETGLGIIPAAGGTHRLARLVGVGRATEMILTGRRLTAQEALDAGLVTSVTSPEQLMGQARETAARIMSKGPLAAQLATTVVRQGSDVDRSTGLLLERLAQSVLYGSDERAEGVRAFHEKRQPDYSAHAVVQPHTGGGRVAESRTDQAAQADPTEKTSETGDFA